MTERRPFWNRLTAPLKRWLSKPEPGPRRQYSGAASFWGSREVLPMVSLKRRRRAEHYFTSRQWRKRKARLQMARESRRRNRA